ncbi:MAG: glycosyltransferase family 4 protein [Bacteroidia bacterium]
MKKVLIVTYYWPPSGGAGVQRWVKLSRYFLKQGVQPYVVTVDPEKASYALRDPSLADDILPELKVYHTSTLEPYGIYKTLTRKKEIPYGGFANEGAEVKFTQKMMRFIRGNLFLPDARVGWNRYAFLKCCEIIEKEKIDAVITTSPPHSTQLVGLKLKKKYNLTWMADLRDPWTGIYYYDKLMLTAMSRKRDAAMERSVLENADAVVVVSKSIRDEFLQKAPRLKMEHIHIVPNGFDTADLQKTQPMKTDSSFMISYTGTLTSDYRIDALLEALGKSNEEFRFCVTGALPESIKNKIATSIAEKSVFRAHVKHHDAVAQMKAADMLLLVIPDTDGKKGILTGKLFEYIAVRKPILCIGPVDGDAAEIIRATQSGETFDYADVQGISRFIENYFELKKKNGNTALPDNTEVQRYSRESQAGEVIRILNSIHIRK